MLTFFRVLAGTYMFHHVSYLITVIVAKILCGSPKGSWCGNRRNPKWSPSALPMATIYKTSSWPLCTSQLLIRHTWNLSTVPVPVFWLWHHRTFRIEVAPTTIYVTSSVPCQWFAVAGWCGHDLMLGNSGLMVWCGEVISQPSPTRREGYLTKYIPLYTSGTKSVLRVIEMRGGLGG